MIMMRPRSLPCLRLDDSEREQSNPVHTLFCLLLYYKCSHLPLDLSCNLNIKAFTLEWIRASNPIWDAETEPTSPECTVLFHRIPYRVTGGRAREHSRLADPQANALPWNRIAGLLSPQRPPDCLAFSHRFFVCSLLSQRETRIVRSPWYIKTI